MPNEPKKKPVEPQDSHRTLADLRAGECARIDCVECAHAARGARLMAYGLTRGQFVTLVQTQPAFVIRVDETELALDESIARCVRVVAAD